MPKRGGNGKPVAGDELETRVLETLRRLPGVKSPTAIARATTGTKGALLKAIGRLVEAKQVVQTEQGWFAWRGSPTRRQACGLALAWAHRTRAR